MAAAQQVTVTTSATLVDTATTGPSFERYGALAAMTNVGLSSPNLESATANTGLTTAPPNPFGAQTSAATTNWVALS